MIELDWSYSQVDDDSYQATFQSAEAPESTKNKKHVTRSIEDKNAMVIVLENLLYHLHPSKITL